MRGFLQQRQSLKGLAVESIFLAMLLADGKQVPGGRSGERINVYYSAHLLLYQLLSVPHLHACILPEAC